jgi:hypothetical protein
MHTPEPSTSPPPSPCDDCESYDDTVCASGYCVIEERARVEQENYDDLSYDIACDREEDA